MSFDKTEATTKEEWIKLLEEEDGKSNMNIMNKLIMNYLVTGKQSRVISVRRKNVLTLYCYSLQKGSRKQLKSLAWSQA